MYPVWGVINGGSYIKQNTAGLFKMVVCSYACGYAQQEPELLQP